MGPCLADPARMSEKKSQTTQKEGSKATKDKSLNNEKPGRISGKKSPGMTNPTRRSEKDSQIEESANKAPCLSEMIKVSEEMAQNNDRQCLSNRKHRINQTPQKK